MINPYSSWLKEKGSITEKLIQFAGEAVLDVISHRFEEADQWDHQTLEISLNTMVLHRQILMRASNTVCWYARTIIPQSVYHIEESLFERLKHESLGNLIHPHPDIERVEIRPYTIRPSMTEYAYLNAALKNNTMNEILWGRISVFTLHNIHRFFLLEIFLPPILKYNHESSALPKTHSIK